MENRFRGQAAQEFGDHVTLKQKLKEHYNNRDFKIKKVHANKFGVSYFLIVMLFQYTVGMREVIPAVCSPETQLLWKMFITLVLFQSFIHWFMCARKYLNKVEKRPEDENRADVSGWVYCSICQQPVPPRAHHCNLCKVCILRHDHHCFFAGGCIGFYTVASFIYMCAWLITSQITCVLFQLNYMYLHHDSWIDYIPWYVLYRIVIDWSWTSVFDFLLLVNIGLVAVNLTTLCIYLALEVISMRWNQTFHEGSKGVCLYHTGSIISNLHSTLGEYWWIRWLIPLMVSPVGDGYDWKDYMKQSQ